MTEYKEMCTCNMSTRSQASRLVYPIRDLKRFHIYNMKASEYIISSSSHKCGTTTEYTHTTCTQFKSEKVQRISFNICVCT